MSEHLHSDYTDWIQGIWQKNIEFSDLVTYANQKNFPPSLAAVLYQTWLKRNRTPNDVFAWFNLGVSLFSEKDFTGAQEAYESALAIKPNFVAARFNLGLVYEQLNNAQAALAQWKQVEETANSDAPDELAVLVSALNGIGRLQETLKQYQPACEALEKSLLLKPNQSDVIHHLVFMRQKQCRWPIYEPIGVTEENTLRKATSALAMLNISDEPGTQLTAALNYSRKKIPTDLSRLAPLNGYQHEKIRIAYCSGDFCTHPVAMLTVELFEQHDREKFEIFAFCWSPNDGSKLRQRIIQAVDHYIPIHNLNDAESAKLIREHEIDILIDLHGQTNKARIQMLAHRPAPIQITYLGLPATTGLPCIDYVIADRFLIPEEYAGFYSEKPLYMPDIYQVSDRKREISPAPDRESCGLPRNKFVFCSFNNNHKYTLEVFTAWMNILRRVPESILWLLADNPWAESNLRKQAELQGIDPTRLIFAERTLPADYLARYHVADLFLDTFPFNAGTTANDALWMELPVLTLCGRSFASRMAGALLTAAGLPELITYDLEAYENKAVALAQNAKTLKKLRRKLTDAKTNGPLFNTTQFTANLESHYVELVATFNRQASAIESAKQVVSISEQPQKPKQLTDIVIEAEQLQARSDIAGAIQTYRQWIEYSHLQDKWMAWFNLGVLLSNSDDLIEAKRAFQEVLQQQPGFVQARKALELLHNRLPESKQQCSGSKKTVSGWKCVTSETKKVLAEQH
jgi:predicted O-linked N-acetylglucosamine transferase (SPINDLY family)